MDKTISEAFWYNISLGTTFYAVQIDTGKVISLKAPGFLFVHTLNAFEQDKNTIVLDVDGVSEVGYLQEGLKDKVFNKTFRDSSINSKLMRYTLHLDTGRVDGVEAVPSLNDAVPGLSRFNDNFRGRQACFAYAPAGKYNSSSYDSTATVKMDLCHGSVPAFYYAYGHLHGESIFVPRPSAVEEDDGAVLGLLFDGVNQQTYMNVLDGKTMKQVAKAYLPFRLPFMLHSHFYLRAASVETAIV